MNESQYTHLRQNRRYYGPALLGDAYKNHAGSRSPLASILARAASQLHCREQALTAWQRIAQPEWLSVTTVEAIDTQAAGGCTLIIAVDHPTALYDLERHKNSLQRQLSRLVPAVRRVRFVLSASSHCAGDAPNESSRQ